MLGRVGRTKELPWNEMEYKLPLNEMEYQLPAPEPPNLGQGMPEKRCGGRKI